MEVLDGLLGLDLDQLGGAQQVVEARRQEVVVGDVEGTLVLQEVDERLRLAREAVDPMRLGSHEVDQHRDVVRRAGLRRRDQPVELGVEARQQLGADGVLDDRQPSRSMASISDPIETSGPKRSMWGSVMLAPFGELLAVVVTS